MNVKSWRIYRSTSIMLFEENKKQNGNGSDKNFVVLLAGGVGNRSGAVMEAF